MDMSIRGRAATLALTALLSGGKTNQNNEPIDTESPSEPIAITETYNEETQHIIKDTDILTYEQSMALFDYALQVDVSSCNGEIDWKKLNGEIHPVQAIIRSHYINGSSFEEDSRFEENVKGCSEIGLPVGVYLIARLTQSEDEVIRETNTLIQRLNEVENKYNIKINNVVIDYEEKSHIENPETSAKSIKIMHDMLTEKGYNFVIYSTSSCKKDLDTAAKNNNIDIEEVDSWIAGYSQQNSYAVTSETQSLESAINNANIASYENAAAQQIADNVFTEGSEYTKIDISIIKDKSLTQTAKKEDNTLNIYDNIAYDAISHIVREGETISEICEDYNLTIDELLEYNPEIDDINIIKVGDIVRIPTEKFDNDINQNTTNKKNINKKDNVNVLGALALFGGSALGAYALKGIVERKKAVRNSYRFKESDVRGQHAYSDSRRSR